MNISCNNQTTEETGNESYEKGTLGYDLQFLKQHDTSLIQLKSGMPLRLSHQNTGKVFTSGPLEIQNELWLDQL